MLLVGGGRVLWRKGLLPVTCGVKRVGWREGLGREKGFVPVEEGTWKVGWD